MKSCLCLILSAILLFQCFPSANGEKTDTLIVETVTFGADYRDLEAVEQAINKIIAPLIHANIKLMNTDVRSHASTLNQMIANGEQLDLVMAGMTLPMTQLAVEGKLLPLDTLLEETGGDITELFGGKLEAGRVNGVLYAIPADAYSAQSGGFVYNQRMAEIFGIEMHDPITIAELEQVFSIIRSKDPEIYGTVFGSGETSNLLYDYCLEDYGSALYAYGVTFDPCSSTEIENAYDSVAFAEYVKRHRRWIEKGYAPKDSLISGIRSKEYVANEKVFGMTTNYSPIEGPVQQGNYTFPIGIVQLTPAVNSTGSIQERMWGIPVTSKDPQKAMQFLDLMFTNAEIANLLSNGIEGLHYQQVAPGVITYAPGANPLHPGYASVFSRFGNQMQVLHWLPATPDFYNELSAFNARARNSLSLGYVFNGESVSSEIAAVNAVVSLYLPALECGMLSDVDAALAAFNQELKNAGIDRIIEENQRQLDAWLNEKGQSETLINTVE